MSAMDGSSDSDDSVEPSSPGHGRSLTSDAVIPVTIGVLAAAFSAAIIVLVVVCRRRHCRYGTLQVSCDSASSTEDLVPSREECEHGVELDDVGAANSQLNEILRDETWVKNAASVAPDCLAILKLVHELTERLIRGTLQSAQQQLLHSPEILAQLVSVARRIGPRVDDVVNALYPPLDPRLFEARCSALILSVNHLVLLTKKTGTVTNDLDWVDQSLADVEDHLQSLRVTSMAYENSRCSLISASPANITADNACLV